MRKAAIILIVIGLLVVIAANLFIADTEAPTAPPVRDDTTLRQTTAGDVVGFRGRHGARTWLGIPFARPPVGDLRWRAPQPPEPHDGVLEAMHIGDMCPQFASALSGAGLDPEPGAVAGQEDCLYLNVFSPPNASDLPVMFWIHGGGNSIGHGGSYNGGALATQHDVVVVTINYRLGIFGWFSHPDLSTGDRLDDSGNYGTLDTIRALAWVRDNIDRFGGDPGNITVFGESAGARNTLALMATPLAQGLFHRAVVQSGSYRTHEVQQARALMRDGGDENSSRELIARLLAADGSVEDLEAARDYQADMSRRNVRDYLYGKTAPELFTALSSGEYSMARLPLMFRDGHVLPDLETEEIFSNPDKHTVVPIILGTNRDEPAIFMVQDPDYVESWLGFLPRLKDEDTYRRIVKYGAMSWKVSGADSLAKHMTKAGNPDVFVYRWDYDEQPSLGGLDLSVALGAAHGLEIPFVFNEFEDGLPVGYLFPHDEAQAALANSMSSYWAEFAHSGDPGRGRSGNEVTWLRWGVDGKRSIILDTPNDQGIFMDDAEVTMASLKRDFLADAGWSTPSERCKMYVRTFRDEHFVQSEYLGLNDACAGIDPGEVPDF